MDRIQTSDFWLELGTSLNLLSRDLWRDSSEVFIMHQGKILYFLQKVGKDVADLIKVLAARGFPMSRTDIQNITFQYAKANGVKGFSEKKQKAGYYWFWRLSEKKPTSEYLYPRSCCCWKFWNLSYTGFWMVQKLWTTSQRTQDHWRFITHLDFQGIWIKRLLRLFRWSPGCITRRNRNSPIWIECCWKMHSFSALLFFVLISMGEDRQRWLRSVRFDCFRNTDVVVILDVLYKFNRWIDNKTFKSSTGFRAAGMFPVNMDMIPSDALTNTESEMDKCEETRTTPLQSLP